jgi:hypothetical protein
MSNRLPLRGKKVCAVVSGGNIDVNILSRVINRGLLASGRLTNLTIELIEKPGSCARSPPSSPRRARTSYGFNTRRAESIWPSTAAF